MESTPSSIWMLAMALETDVAAYVDAHSDQRDEEGSAQSQSVPGPESTVSPPSPTATEPPQHEANSRPRKAAIAE
jgi:hypothetical protein